MEKGASDKSVSYSKRVIMAFDSQVETHSQDFIIFLIGSFRLPSPHVITFFTLKARRLSLSWLAGCSYAQAKSELKGVFES